MFVWISQLFDNKMQVCYGKVTLNESIARRNFLGCLVHYFMLSFVFVSVDSLQPLLLQKSFQIDRKEQIENFKNALVIIFDIVVKLLCAPLFGHLADRLGRRTINIYGIVCVSATMFLMPYAPTYWLYVVLRCIYATGAIAISVIPLLADYVSHASRGTSTAFLVLMSSFGALGSAEINFSLLENVSSDEKIYVQYGVIATMIMVIGLLYSLFCLKPGNDYYPRSSRPNKTLKELMDEAKASLKTPQIANSYTAAFLARSDSILLSLYLVLWTYSFSDPSDRSDKVYQDAFRKSSMLSGIAYATIMLTCIIYGFYYARRDYSRSKIMIVMLVLAAVGSASLNFAKDPSSFMAIVSMVVLGLGMSGLLSASLYLVNEYSTPESRGFITGLQTWFGVVGILFQTIVGALLYEITRCGPFDYFSVTCLIVLFVTLVIYSRSKNELTNHLMDGSTLTEPAESRLEEQGRREEIMM